MKKFLIIVLALALVVLSLSACSTNETTQVQTTTQEQTQAQTTSKTEDPTPIDKVLSYASYVKAALDTKVTIVSYVQAKQSWWDNKGTFYLVDEDGAYFVYEMPISQDEYNKLVPGTKVKISGTKAEWSGEVEIIDATYTILTDDTYIAKSYDVTESLFNTNELYNHVNRFVKFTNLTVAEKKDADGNSCAFLYKWNGSGTQGDDLYFDVIAQGQKFTFTVESYLCDKNSDVYKAVESLKIGDKIDCEGFLYWYNGANPHITSVVKNESGVMTYEEYNNAELETSVVVEAYVQGKQSWWDNKATLYLEARDGAYFVYNMPISQEDYDKLSLGTKIRVSGTKTAWSGEVEIIDATYTVLDGKYMAEGIDVTEFLGKPELINYQNRFVKFSNLTISEKKDADGNSCAFLYKWNGSGDKGDDLYFDVKLGDDVYTFTVESYLCDQNSDVYKAVENFKIGDTVDLEGFLYWYNGVNPHITCAVVK